MLINFLIVFSSHLCSPLSYFVHVIDDPDEDDDSSELAYGKRSRKESNLARKKIERNDPTSKSKKKGKVLVEVYIHKFTT